MKYLVLGVLIFLMCIVSAIFLQSTIEVSYEEKLCVDGHGDKNLEGIMCKKEVYNTEINRGSAITLAIFSLLGLFLSMAIILVGLSNLKEKKE